MQHLKAIVITTIVILVVLLALLPLRSKKTEVQIYSPRKSRPEVGSSKSQGSDASYPVGQIHSPRKSRPKVGSSKSQGSDASYPVGQIRHSPRKSRPEVVSSKSQGSDASYPVGQIHSPRKSRPEVVSSKSQGSDASYPVGQIHSPHKSRPEVGSSKSQGSDASYPVGLIGLVNKTDPKAHCCNILEKLTVTLEQLCKADGSIKLSDIAKRAEAQQCTCVDFFYCKLVVVTAISSNHYEEAQDMIASVQKFLPSTKLILYDLGLSAAQKGKLQRYCNVEVRSFRFEKYPPHTKNLQLYAWKTFIIKEVASEYEVLFWGDSSARVIGSSFADKVFPFLLKFPFVAGSTTPLPIVSLTHDGMLKYLNMTVTRKQMGQFGHLEANCWVMWANSLMRTKFITHWVDCGLHQKCISPDGASLYSCNFGLGNKNKGAGLYVGCHRYDQSALSMILIREFGVQVWDKVAHNEAKAIFRVHRGGITHQPIKLCSS